MREEKTLIYFHGFQSSGQSGTVGRLQRNLPHFHIIAPDIVPDPLEALDQLHRLCVEIRPDIIIGTSLGGFYVHQMAGYRRIAVNPALHLSEKPEILYPGRYEYLHPTRSGETTFEITEEIIHHFVEAERHQWDYLKGRDGADEPILGYFGTRDTTVNCRDEFARHYGTDCCHSFDGEHRLDDATVRDVLAPAILRLTDT